jgi:hypothetical protein
VEPEPPLPPREPTASASAERLPHGSLSCARAPAILVLVSATAANRSDPVALVRLDAVICAASGIVLGVAAPVLDGLLGVPIVVLLLLGMILLAFGGYLALVARNGPSAASVKGLAVGNLLWAAMSVVVVAADWLTLTTAGTIVALLQAASVAVLAGFQFRALSRARADRARSAPATS